MFRFSVNKCKANQHITPNAMPAHNNGILYGLNPTPAQFQPSADYYASLRQQYKNGLVNENLKKKMFSSKSFDTYMTKLKNAMVGKNTICNATNGLSFKCYDNNLVKQRLQHVRNGSCVTPAKAKYRNV